MNGRTDFNPNLSWIFFLAAIVLFLLGAFVDDRQVDFMMWGLAAFAAGHLA